MKRLASLGTAIFLLLTVSCSALYTRGTPAPFSKRISFSILEDYDKGENLKEVAADFALFRELGVTTWRGSFGWDDYEPSRGNYDFAWLHRFAELAARNDITLRPYSAIRPNGPPDKEGPTRLPGTTHLPPWTTGTGLSSLWYQP
ncbi:MAG: beta-galactosidase [Alphaproteobacteria bacterium]|uniref:Beta-galactosidase n=1 Tax=Candidatus Nitrobium versatile TaxID=2884831 RepID=A0A953M2H7_9BACT|nr:beta-galactosidase [Candidatus Nitrobium versatile]